MKRALAIFFNQTLGKLSKSMSRKNLSRFLGVAIDQYIGHEGEFLNVGAGGAIAEELKNRGITCSSIDVDPNRKPDMVMNLETLDGISDNSIDAIFCLEVLEHVKQPWKAAEAIFRVLKADGILIGSTPFLFPLHDEPHDYYRYTIHGIKHLFSPFTCLELKERNNYLDSVSVLLTRFFLVGTPRQKIAAALLSPFVLFVVLVLFPLSFITNQHQGTTGYFFVFQKPQANISDSIAQ